MATLHEQIYQLRQKPEHVRTRIAYGVSAGVTGLVALIWAVTLATSGTLAIKQPSPVAGDAVDESVKQSFAQSTNAFSELLGAVGAAGGLDTKEAELNVVKSETTSTFDTKITNDTDKTVIPF